MNTPESLGSPYFKPFQSSLPFRSAESDTADDEPPGTSLKIEKAADMIKELLSDGAKPAADIIAACEELRISPKTARRARSKLGADTYTKDGVTVWELR